MMPSVVRESEEEILFIVTYYRDTILSECSRLNIPIKRVTAHKWKAESEANAQIIVSWLNQRLLFYMKYVGDQFDLVLHVGENVSRVQLAQILDPFELSLEEYKERIRVELSIATSNLPFRGELANKFRSIMWHRIGSVQALDNESTLVRRSYYLSKFGIVVSEMLTENDQKWKESFEGILDENRIYLFQLLDRKLDEESVLKSLKSSKPAFKNFKEYCVARMYEELLNFKFCQHSQPEAQYVSLLWAPLFELGRRYTISQEFLTTTTEYNLKNLPQYNHDNYVDLAYLLDATSKDSVFFSAPIFILEASGYFRDKNGVLKPMKDLVKIAVAMFHVFHYWFPVVKGDEDAEQRFRVYGAFANKTELQLLCMFAKKDHKNDDFSVVLQCGESWSFRLDHLDLEPRNALFRSNASVDLQFKGSFRMTSDVDNTQMTPPPHVDFDPQALEQSRGLRQSNDFSTCPNELRFRYLAVLDGFVSDIAEYSEWFKNYIARKDGISPGLPPPDTPKEFPQSGSSHFHSSPKKDYWTAGKKDGPSAANGPSGRNSDSPSPSCAASRYIQKHQLTIVYRIDRQNYSFAEVKKNGEKSVVIAKTCGNELEILVALQGAQHVVCLFDVMHVETRFIVFHMEQLQPVRFTSRDFFVLLPLTVDYILDGLSGLIEMARLQIVHGDISPNNFMYSSRDSKYKFIDFDRSFFVGDKTFGFQGTPGFEAPELKHGHCTFSSDLYSFGKVVLEVAMSFLEDCAASFGFFESPVYVDLEHLVYSMLRNDPNERPTAEMMFDYVLEYWSEYSTMFGSNRYTGKVALRKQSRMILTHIRANRNSTHEQEYETIIKRDSEALMETDVAK